jgi:precorrin-6A/cobalt-precorrin-6A reductase
MRILILGGTTEASALIRRLANDARFQPTLSLAGRTADPARHGIPTRTGGFGGADGLAQWISENAIDAVVDATHPFAPRISANAVAATSRLSVPLCTIIRPPWERQTGDEWHNVESTEAAAQALGAEPRRVFLGIGRQELDAFAAAPQHTYIARVIDRPGADHLPPKLTLITERGPFALDGEIALLKREGIDVVVSKNSGGAGTYAKIEAARALGIPVVMIARPHKATGDAVGSVEGAVLWLTRHHARTPRSERGV